MYRFRFPYRRCQSLTANGGSNLRAKRPIAPYITCHGTSMAQDFTHRPSLTCPTPSGAVPTNVMFRFVWFEEHTDSTKKRKWEPAPAVWIHWDSLGGLLQKRPVTAAKPTWSSHHPCLTRTSGRGASGSWASAVVTNVMFRASS